MAPYAPDDIEDQEAAMGGQPDDTPDTTGAAVEAEGLETEPSDFAPNIEKGESKFGKARDIYKKAKKYKMAIAAGGSILSLVGLFISSSFLPFQLVHVKEAYMRKYTGSQVAIIDQRLWKVYTRFFFFRDENGFAGYKGGLFEQAFTNTAHKNMAIEMKKKGITIHARLDKLTGNWTGQFDSVTLDKPITDPKTGKLITSIDKNSSLWQRRQLVKAFVGTSYANENILFRTFRTTLLYRKLHWGIARWWSDNALTRALDRIEDKWKGRLKDAIKGNSEYDPTKMAETDNQTAEERAANDPDGSKAKAATELESSAKQVMQNEVGGKGTPINIDNPLGKHMTTVGRGLLKSALITAAASIACDIKRAINSIVVMSRSAKAAQLAQSTLRMFTLADAVKAGDNSVGPVMNEAMYMMNSVDPETQKTFFASGGWGFVNGDTAKPTYTNTYDTGGGLTGDFAAINNAADTICGGPGAVEQVCSVLSKWYVQLGSAVVGIGVSLIPGVGQGIQVWRSGMGIAQGVAYSVVLGVATELAIKLAVGTFVDGSEKGEKMGDMMTAGAGSMFGINATNMGMRPLTTTEYAHMQQQYLALEKEELSQKSFFARYFDPARADSITGRAISTMATIKYSSFAKTLGSIPSMLFAPLKNNSAIAEGYSCSQADIIEKNIQTDPFCNPIMGNTDTELDKIDPLDNVKWMIDSGYVDGDGNPMPTDVGQKYTDYVNYCFENEKVNVLFKSETQFTSPFTERCYEKGEDTGDGIGLSERFRAFRLDSTLVLCAAETIETGACEGDASGSDNTTNYSGEIVYSDDTTDIPCDPNTRDAGVRDGYSRGKPVKIRVCSAHGIIVNSQISRAVYNLINDAKADGVNLSGSGYRTMAQQIRLRTSNGCPDIYDSPAKTCRTPTARPGYSNHQMGFAVDFKWNGSLIKCPGSIKAQTCRDYGRNLGFNWLDANVSRYGLKSLKSEAWHWSTTGG